MMLQRYLEKRHWTKENARIAHITLSCDCALGALVRHGKIHETTQTQCRRGIARCEYGWAT